MRMKDKEQSTKTMKLTPSVHADLIGLARYGDSLSDVVERLIDFLRKIIRVIKNRVSCIFYQYCTCCSKAKFYTK